MRELFQFRKIHFIWSSHDPLPIGHHYKSAGVLIRTAAAATVQSHGQVLVAVDQVGVQSGFCIPDEVEIDSRILAGGERILGLVSGSAEGS